ncbi:hypothetical protein PHET_11187 [Paragonimus heterotremus]|uniref:Uncharacterized protein n=1 Tax=Paragonimus heterotremus TaxID=100268 RepID=A0A8J4T597_9TREM|nr:hypothetical protein PHET_11187 [Paragonimus heterotremus]
MGVYTMRSYLAARPCNEVNPPNSVREPCTNLTDVLVTAFIKSALQVARKYRVNIETSQIAIGPDERLQFSFDHGSNLAVTLTVASQPVGASVDYANKRVLSEPLSVSQASQIAYAITVANPLGDQHKSGLVDFIEPISGNERCVISNSSHSSVQITVKPRVMSIWSIDPI